MTHELLERALGLVDEGARDPIKAVQNQRALRQLLEAIRSAPPAAPARSASFGPLEALGVTRIVRVADVPAIAPGQIAGPLKVEWPGGDGLVRSVFAGTTDGELATLSQLSVRISLNGGAELFTTGIAEAFVPLLAFQASNHNWFRLKDTPVTPNAKWAVYFRNESTTGPVRTPFLLFGYADQAAAG